MKRPALMLVVFLLGAALVSAQSKKFVWSDEICTFEGTYRRYTEKQLENTFRLWYSRDFVMDGYRGSISVAGLLERRTTASLDAEYVRKSAALRDLEIVNVPYWKAFKQKKLKILEQDYRLARATVRAFQTPTALEEVKFAGACVKRFAPPMLAGGDELLNFWRELNEEKRRKSDSPEILRENFESKIASTDKFKYAQEEILISDWWDCAGSMTARADDDAVLYKNFRKLFRRVKRLGCDFA
jgi:hypothetical protein